MTSANILDNSNWASTSSPGLFPQKLGGAPPIFWGKSPGDEVDWACSKFKFSCDVSQTVTVASTAFVSMMYMFIAGTYWFIFILPLLCFLWIWKLYRNLNLPCFCVKKLKNLRAKVNPPPGGYSHTLPIRVCAAQRGPDFEAKGLERGIYFRGVF